MAQDKDILSEEAPTTNPPPPFDWADLRSEETDPDLFEEASGAEFPIRRPLAHHWFRVHPHADYQRYIQTLDVPDGDHEGLYLVGGRAVAAMATSGVLKPKRFNLCVTTDGALCLWPLSPLTGRNKDNGWVVSAHKAATTALTQWARIESSMEAKRYRVFVNPDLDAEPRWPEMSPLEILQKSFEGRYIADPNHEVLLPYRQGRQVQ